MRENKLLITISITILMLLSLSGCGKSRGVNTAKYRIFYPNDTYTSLMSEEREMDPETAASGDITEELLNMLSEAPLAAGGTTPISGKVSVLSDILDGGCLTIDLEEGYRQLPVTNEVLIRAAIVETMVQSDRVDTVVFTVEGEPLKDRDGKDIGPMSAESFITDTGDELNLYDRTNLTLYFTNMDGTSLKRYDQEVVYNANMSMEKLAVESLIKGPENTEEQKGYPTLSPEAKLLSVTVKDRIAYVNFDAAVREQPYSVREETAVYSIVNTLTTLPGIDRVQLSVEGSTEGYFFDHMPMDELYSRNDDIINQEPAV